MSNPIFDYLPCKKIKFNSWGRYDFPVVQIIALKFSVLPTSDCSTAYFYKNQV